jgi:hypothetical protein
MLIIFEHSLMTDVEFEAIFAQAKMQKIHILKRKILSNPIRI